MSATASTRAGAAARRCHFAFGAVSDARSRRHLTLIRSDLNGVADAIDLSAATLGKIRQNFLRLHLQCPRNTACPLGC
jgi:hypothetical protein